MSCCILIEGKFLRLLIFDFACSCIPQPRDLKGNYFLYYKPVNKLLVVTCFSAGTVKVSNRNKVIALAEKGEELPFNILLMVLLR